MKRYLKIECIFIVILMLQIANFIFWGYQKEGYHIDEIYSYGLSNSYYRPYVDSNNEHWNVWHNEDYFKQYVEVQADHRFAYDSVYYNQTCDVHPPVYYFILHTVCSFFPNQFSKWFGISINIVFMVAALTILYYISRLLWKENKWLPIIICLFYGFSPGAVNNVIYIRMYVILEFITLLYLYMHLQLMEKYSTKKYIILFGITLLGTLTHYYFLVFAFFVSVVYFITLIWDRYWKRIVHYLIAVPGAIGLAVCIYPSALAHIFSGRGRSAGNILDTEYKEKLIEFYLYISRQLFGGYLKYILCFYIFIAIVIFIVHAISLKRKNETIVLQIEGKYEINCKLLIQFTCIFITAIMYYLIVVKVTTIRADRYIFNIYPLIVLLFFELLWLIYKKLNRIKTPYLIINMLILAAVTYRGYNQESLEYWYKGYHEMQTELSKYQQDKVIYVTPYNFTIYRDWQFLSQTGNYYIVAPEDVGHMDLGEENNNLEHIIVYVYKDLDAQDILNTIEKKLNLTDSDFVLETYQSNVFYCY